MLQVDDFVLSLIDKTGPLIDLSYLVIILSVSSWRLHLTDGLANIISVMLTAVVTIRLAATAVQVTDFVAAEVTAPLSRCQCQTVISILLLLPAPRNTHLSTAASI